MYLDALQFERNSWTMALISRARSTKMRMIMASLIALISFAMVPTLEMAGVLVLWLVTIQIAYVLEAHKGINLIRSRATHRVADRHHYLVYLFATSLIFSTLLPFLWFSGQSEAVIWATILSVAATYQAITMLHACAPVLWACLTPQIVCIVMLAGGRVIAEYDDSSAVPLLALCIGLLLLAFHYLSSARILAAESRKIFQIRDRLASERRNAQSANAAKSRFLAVVSHELRTPMNAMTGSIELFRRTSLDGEQRELLETMSQGTDVLLSLLNDILDFSKVESGQLDVEAIPVDLHKLLDGMVSMWSPRAADKSLDLRLQIGADVPRGISTDPMRLRQVLFNLISNAVKFTNEGEIVLTASVDRTSEATPFLRLGVTDTGCGMSEETAIRIFQPFQQADRSTARRFGGTGLGLSIGRSLAELMGGDLEVQSMEGAGSTFTLFLPLIEEDVPEESHGQGDISRTAGRTLQILVAEDHPANRRILGALLKPLNCEVIIARNGKEAVELFDIDTFDVILMDMQMPEMDGLEATRLIRTMGDAGAKTPIIALTANASTEDRALCQAAGMDDFISKPIDPRLLHAAVLKAIKQDASETSPRAA